MLRNVGEREVVITLRFYSKADSGGGEVIMQRTRTMQGLVRYCKDSDFHQLSWNDKMDLHQGIGTNSFLLPKNVFHCMWGVKRKNQHENKNPI